MHIECAVAIIDMQADICSILSHKLMHTHSHTQHIWPGPDRSYSEKWIEWVACIACTRNLYSRLSIVEKFSQFFFYYQHLLSVPCPHHANAFTSVRVNDEIQLNVLHINSCLLIEKHARYSHQLIEYRNMPYLAAYRLLLLSLSALNRSFKVSAGDISSCSAALKQTFSCK